MKPIAEKIEEKLGDVAYYERDSQGEPEGRMALVDAFLEAVEEAGLAVVAKEQIERHDRVLAKYKAALILACHVIRDWHGSVAWEIYYKASPEMKPVREILGPEWSDVPSREALQLRVEYLDQCPVCGEKISEGKGEHRMEFTRKGGWCNCKGRRRDD